MKFWNENIKKLSPYIPGEQPSNKKLIKLNTNENPYPPSPNIFKKLQEITPNSFPLYPDPLCSALRRNIANSYSINTNEICCANGSDEILNLILRCFLEKQDKVIIPYPNYFLYEVLCQSYGINYEYIKTDDDFNIDFAKLLSKKSNLIFISNPNSPTAKLYNIEDIYNFAREYKGLLVIDEAYIDFASKKGKVSAIHLVDKLDNIIVLRTFSKSFSLASIRLGFAIANPNLIEALMKTKDSYNISYLTQIIGSEAIRDYKHMKSNVFRIIKNRTILSKELRAMQFYIVESEANFIFCYHKIQAAKKIFQDLKKRGIIVRYFNKPMIDNYLRITIGTEEEIRILTQNLKDILNLSFI